MVSDLKICLGWSQEDKEEGPVVLHVPQCLPGRVAITPEDSSANALNCQLQFSPLDLPVKSNRSEIPKQGLQPHVERC